MSAHAAAQQPTKLWLKPGERVTVHQMILGIVTRSANDAAVALAEAQAPGEAAFARHMTGEAARLGMSRTVYRNASGLPNSAQHTTARDVARLAVTLRRDFPDEYQYFSIRKVTFHGREITGHNHLLDWYDGADGLKTGFIQASGFNLAASAERHHHRLVGVVLGSPSWQARDQKMGALLDRGFTALTGPADTAVADNTPTDEPSHTAKPQQTPARVAALLSPAPAAHAATLAAEQPVAHSRRHAGETCSIRLGPFHGHGKARHFARTAARVRIVHGAHRHHVVVSRFTREGARRACARLEHTVSCRILR